MNRGRPRGQLIFLLTLKKLRIRERRKRRAGIHGWDAHDGVSRTTHRKSFIFPVLFLNDFLFSEHRNESSGSLSSLVSKLSNISTGSKTSIYGVVRKNDEKILDDDDEDNSLNDGSEDEGNHLLTLFLTPKVLRLRTKRFALQLFLRTFLGASLIL